MKLLFNSTKYSASLPQQFNHPRVKAEEQRISHLAIFNEQRFQVGSFGVR